MTATNNEKQNADGMLRQNIDLETVSTTTPLSAFKH
jgi:hypothetical protein